MVALKHSEMRMLDDIFQMGGGYVLNFSDRTMADFFEEELGIEICQKRYAFSGMSKAKHVRAFIKVEDGYTVGQLLRKLWDYRASYGDRPENEEARDRERLFALIT
jgi:hypothetical protein